jgi:hypothetical protein
MFSKKGVQFFTPDGSTIVKSIPPEKVCKETKNSDSSTRVHCDFYDVVHDGKKVFFATQEWSVPDLCRN